MNVSDLHSIFLQDVQALLPEWRFIASVRHFKHACGSTNWLFHIGFVNHSGDFDALGNVAVEFLAGRKRIATIGAQLGNIAGVGQTRHSVVSPAMATQAARSLVTEFQRVGVPFLQHYSNPRTVVSALESDGQEALLISPIRELHAGQIAALGRLA